ncbi:MAG: ABC transporter ATP-binding protein [Oscillospiraceae bacterium]|nr:ABC transporter ATP-binding protein [Oscillospiraceae bacterium]
MKQPVIELKNFTWQYNAQKEPTLHDLTLTIREGEKVLICGPSGCGKSTLAHCLNGLIPFSYHGEMRGSLHILGRETSELSLFDVSKMVGTVLQDADGQFVGLTVAEDIAFALENDNVPQSELFRRVDAAAEQVNILSHLDHAPNELSGGQKQRVSLAGVMVDNVPILLFDEPLANLDPAAGKQAIELIDDIKRQTKTTVIIIEHRLEDVLHRDVDRVILMQDGRIVADTTPDELLASDLLRAQGIREPLYVTALKHAGVALRPDMGLHNIKALRLDDGQKAAVRRWFRETPPAPEPPEAPALLDARHIRFAYDNGFEALRDVSVTVRKGEMMAIVGRNGAGKSTFSKVVCGFETQQEGTLAFDGRDLTELSIKERADHIGFCLQNPNQMISKVQIFDEVALGLVARGVGEAEQKERVEHALDICGLRPFRHWPVSALSFGQKKRVTIASILALDPEMIILDEPTAGQDFRHYTEIMEFLRELNERGVTVVMITHDMHLMLEYCRRAVVFADGEKIADASPADILTDPDVVARASLRETSLYELAVLCGVDDPRAFVQRFIDHDREVRER